MTLTDSTVVIDYLRTRDPHLLHLFGIHDAALCGVTRAEILHGAKGPANRRNLVTSLSTFRQVPIPETVWDIVGDNLAALQAAGLTIPFTDVVIATVAIAHDIELWARDQHFPMVQTVLPALRLFVEPP
jgi:predicted nucleic acid-binding protein